ncbi:three-Cys-motif partner protein TcmP [Novosphingobium sp. BL-8H]|uniref:three-Cys-motif partner protein TcmP n=1 Tax=Novosphingobium sp. BL-8H TaxID=3127640 RepID=UPI00375778D3
MRPHLSNYAGREQAYVKHHFLADYVERLVFKVASVYRDVVYIDGFSGPWKDQGQSFEDTSFGIALEALRRAKAEWKRIKGVDVTMTALLVERDPEAYRRLLEVIPLYPDIRIKTFSGEFVPLVDDLIKTIPPGAFTFVLMDPKGWKIDMSAVAPLIGRSNTEVVLNFMFDFINRFAMMDQPAIQAGLDALLPATDWRKQLAELAADPMDRGANARKDVLVSAISEVIARLGRYPHVMETPVLYPTKDRTFYSLIYATRSDVGIEVFRECQHDALKAQDLVRDQLKADKRAQATLMDDMFAGTPTGNEFAAKWMAEQEVAARAALIAMIPEGPASVRYGDVWPAVLAKHGVRRRRLARLAAELRASGTLKFLDWAQRKQVPDDDYRVQR